MDGVNTEQLSNRLLDLNELLVQFLEIDRKIHMRDGKLEDRAENDTEHSFNLAMMGWYLCGAFPHLDKNKVIRYALAHDLVEIHAGDVMAVGRTKQQEEKKIAREQAALEKLTAEWPDFADMTDTITAYEAQIDPESVFVKALDKLAPLIHNVHSQGRTWKLLDIERSTIIALKDNKIKPSEDIFAIWQEFRKTIMDHPEFFNEGKAT